MGYAPKFTHTTLDELTGTKGRSVAVLPQARRVAWDWAICAWKAFKREEP